MVIGNTDIFGGFKFEVYKMGFIEVETNFWMEALKLY